MTLHSNRPEVLKPGTAVTRYSQTLGKDMTYFAEPILVAGQTVAFARVAVPVADREARLVDLGRAIRNGVLLAALVSLLLAGYFAKRMTHPLREIAALVREIVPSLPTMPESTEKSALSTARRSLVSRMCAGYLQS